MKNHLLPKGLSILIILFCLSSISLHSQTCYPEGIIFSTQDQIDNFQTNNPGCTNILGDVTIEESVGGNIIDLNGLSVLDTIGGSLTIRGNTDLSTLSGLGNLTAIVMNLTIQNNSTLSGLGALSSLSDSIHDLTVNNCPNLLGFDGLNGVTKINGNLEVSDNAGLTSLNGLGSITEIGGHLLLSNCAALPGPGGMGSVVSIGTDLRIQNNNTMTGLSALGSVTSVGGGISVINNDLLTELTGLANIDPLSITSLTIKDNATLTMCEVQSVCDYLSADGTSDIANNATGCNSESEVETACTNTSIMELFSTSIPTILTYPNPTTGIFHIEAENLEGSELSIFNTTGMLIQKLQITQNGQVDLSNLPNGLYFLELRNKDFLGIGKILKE
jgi:Secretion system C-terminal sorting domain